MYMLRRSVIVAGILFLSYSESQSSEIPTPATQTFLDNHQGSVYNVKNGQLSTLYGVTFTTDENPNTTTLDFVQT